MLRTLRSSVSSIIAKIFIGLLIVSFAIWGIADYTMGGGDRYVATVGDAKITPQEYQEAFRLEMDLLSQQFKQRLTRDQAIQLGLPNRVLSRIVNGKATLEHANELNLGVSDKAIIDDIRSEKAFLDDQGQFDKQIYQNVLANSGLSQAQYEDRRRHHLLLRQLTSPLDHKMIVPKIFTNSLNHYRQNQRSIRYFNFPETAIAKENEPDEKILKNYYDGHLNRYKTTEFRMVDYIDLSPGAIATSIQVNDEELKNLYDKNKQAYIEPEQRTIWQMTFKSIEAAQTAFDRLENGEEFLDVAKSTGLKEEDVKLEPTTKQAFLDKKIADVAFGLEKGKYSKPVKGAFSFAIVKINDIKEKKEKSYDEMKNALSQQIKQSKANEKITDLYDQIEDKRASGARLKEVAKDLNLAIVTVDAVDRAGMDREKKVIDHLPEKGKLLQQIYKSDIGDDTSAIDTKDGGYVIFEVLRIEPVKQLVFEEVKGQVFKDWQEAEYRKKMISLSVKLAKQVEDGSSIEDIAKKNSSTVATSELFSRGANLKDIPVSVLKRAFLMTKNAVSSSWNDEKNVPIIYQINEVKQAEPIQNENARKYLETEISKQYANDKIAQYSQGLQDRYHVNINTDLIKQIINR